MDAQIKKGILEMCILYSILNEKRYGYDIMQTMHLYFPEVNESTFYAILRRLNKEGAADTFIGEESNGPKRKYYFITEKGWELLKRNISDWFKLCKIMKDIGIEEKEIF